MNTHTDNDAQLIIALLAQYKTDTSRNAPTAGELAYDAEAIGNGRKVFGILKRLERANIVKSHRHINMTCPGVTISWTLA